MISKEMIRKRQSYSLFLDFLKLLKSKASRKTILNELYLILDWKRAFHSQTNADYARESLNQVIIDCKLR